ncbi:unnamed protein product [Paramecium sonneborni]|uniref:Uncharacterized protein n=1 Tax=Paramecium sonneborni TaxID=65129 RepID=A0A8S1QGD9_9CILI|nr:unnamed protein product [Paramecium sonneborni]
MMMNNKEIENVKLVALSGFDDDAESKKCEKLILIFLYQYQLS